jgi:hypothetical protein
MLVVFELQVVEGLLLCFGFVFSKVFVLNKGVSFKFQLLNLLINCVEITIELAQV